MAFAVRWCRGYSDVEVAHASCSADSWPQPRLWPSAKSKMFLPPTSLASFSNKRPSSISTPAYNSLRPVHSILELQIKMAQALQSLYKYAIPLAVGASFVQASIYDVKGGSRAVIFDRLAGVKETVVNEGTHFLIPWLQKSIIYDVRTKPRNISTTTGSKDLQMVSLTLRVLHRPEVQALPKIYQVSPTG